MVLTAPRPGRIASRVRLGPLLLGCAVLAALSLPLLHQPTYDPAAWLIWGRQLADGTLATTGGPSWKPFPVLLTTPFSLLGDPAAQWLWMWTARFGGFAAVALAYVLTRRLGGRAEALTAAVALAVAAGFAYNFTRGDAEGLLVAFVFAGVLAGLEGRLRLALAFGLLAAMIRPEVAPLLVLLGVWMLRRTRSPWTLLLLGGAAVTLVAAWWVPEHVGSGEGLRAATRAQFPVAGSPGQSAFPFGMTFVAAAPFLAWPLYVGALVRVRDAWRAPVRTRADLAVLWIAAGSTIAMFEVAIGAELGFTGRLRYATLPACGVAILGGLGLPGLVRLVRARGGRAPQALLATLAGGAVAFSLGGLVWGGLRLAQNERRYGPELSALIDAGGGAAAVRACGPLAASGYERQIVAWRLDVDPATITTRGVATSGTLLVLGDTASRLPLRAREGDWQLRSAC